MPGNYHRAAGKVNPRLEQRWNQPESLTWNADFSRQELEPAGLPPASRPLRAPLPPARQESYFPNPTRHINSIRTIPER